MLPTFNDQRMRLTKTVVEKIPFDLSRSVIYRDHELPGFGLRVGKTSKSYFVEGRVKGTNRRKVIGSHILYTPESARREAKRILLEMSQGKNPCQKDDIALAEITVAKAFEDYIGSRSLKATTLHDYKPGAGCAFIVKTQDEILVFACEFPVNESSATSCFGVGICEIRTRSNTAWCSSNQGSAYTPVFP